MTTLTNAADLLLRRVQQHPGYEGAVGEDLEPCEGEAWHLGRSETVQ